MLIKLQKSRELYLEIVQKQFSEAENIGLDRELPKERYISPEKRQKIIDDLRLI